MPAGTPAGDAAFKRFIFKFPPFSLLHAVKPSLWEAAANVCRWGAEEVCVRGGERVQRKSVLERVKRNCV